MLEKFKYLIKHLLVSIFIVSLCLSLILLFWYPNPLYKATGVSEVFLLIFTLDVIIGPILGFIVYKKGKKSLKVDLSIIIGLQFIALSYGLYTLAQARPVWIVYYKDGFELIQKNHIYIADEEVKSIYKEQSYFGPLYVSVSDATNAKHKNDDIIFEMSGLSVAQMPHRYTEFEASRKLRIQYAQDISHLVKFNSHSKIEKILIAYPEAKYFYPLKSSFEDMTILVDKNFNVIKIVDLRPWN